VDWQLTAPVLSDDARAALARLRSSFEATATLYPSLRHVLVEAADSDAFAEANITVPFV
jgi:hypothetical protein